jgi:hypothetical protein
MLPPITSQRTPINPQQPPSDTPQGEPARARHLVEEADIASGEKTPSEHDTDELIRQVPPQPGARGKPPVEPPSPTHDRS